MMNLHHILSFLHGTSGTYTHQLLIACYDDSLLMQCMYVVWHRSTYTPEFMGELYNVDNSVSPSNSLRMHRWSKDDLPGAIVLYQYNNPYIHTWKRTRERERVETEREWESSYLTLVVLNLFQEASQIILISRHLDNSSSWNTISTLVHPAQSIAWLLSCEAMDHVISSSDNDVGRPEYSGVVMAGNTKGEFWLFDPLFFTLSNVQILLRNMLPWKLLHQNY